MCLRVYAQTKQKTRTKRKNNGQELLKLFEQIRCRGCLKRNADAYQIIQTAQLFDERVSGENRRFLGRKCQKF